MLGGPLDAATAEAATSSGSQSPAFPQLFTDDSVKQVPHKWLSGFEGAVYLKDSAVARVQVAHQGSVGGDVTLRGGA